MDRLSDEELITCEVSTAAFARGFMPKHFPRPFALPHYELMRALDDPAIERILVTAFRGCGKTTLIKAHLAKRIVFGQSKYIPYISSTDKKAEKDTENLKKELQSNRLILAHFGDQQGSIWSREKWITAGGTLIEPMGNGMQIRGSIHENYRPDFIVVDDLEDRVKMKSEIYQEETFEYLYSDVLPLVDKSKPGNKIVVLNTPTNEKSLSIRLKDDPSWHRIWFPLCDEEFHSYYPEYLKDSEVAALVDDHQRNGMMDVFYREYMLETDNDEDADFTDDMFLRYEESDSDFREIVDELENVVVVDPGKSMGRRSCETAIVCYGFHRRLGRFYIRHIENGKFEPDEIVTRTHRVATRFKAKAVGVEVTSLNRFITQPFEDIMAQERAKYEFVPLEACGRAKEDRILALKAYYNRGAIYHNRRACGVLEHQLKRRNSARKDVKDAAAYMIEMQKKGKRRFGPNGHSKAKDGEVSRFGRALTPVEERARRVLSQADWNRC